MKDDIEAVAEVMSSAALVRLRLMKTEGEEDVDRSWQRVTCHLHREDLSWGAVPVIYALSALSFIDARPRGNSGIEYVEDDEWLFSDVIQRLHLERGLLVFEADYVRGRMMKTTVTVGPDGKVVIETRNRHEMALRWLQTLRGKKHIQLVSSRGVAEP
jgi:hypothetical protein